jgi:hypothetical protein
VQLEEAFSNIFNLSFNVQELHTMSRLTNFKLNKLVRDVEGLQKLIFLVAKLCAVPVKLCPVVTVTGFTFVCSRKLGFVEWTFVLILN